MSQREQFAAARRHVRVEPSLFTPSPEGIAAGLWSAAKASLLKQPKLTYGCACKSCTFTNRHARTGFAKWPCDAPKGKRASDAEYRAHASELWEGVARHALRFTPGQAPMYPSLPDLVHPVPRNAAAIAWNAGKKASPVLAEPARPAQPGKAKPHFPELDRQPETAVIYDMAKSKAAKRGRGRPAIGRRVVVNLEEEHIKRAEKLGNGTIAAGIRKALSGKVQSG